MHLDGGKEIILPANHCYAGVSRTVAPDFHREYAWWEEVQQNSLDM